MVARSLSAGPWAGHRHPRVRMHGSTQHPKNTHKRRSRGRTGHLGNMHTNRSHNPNPTLIWPALKRTGHHTLPCSRSHTPFSQESHSHETHAVKITS